MASDGETTVPISVIILTLNEEINISDCLKTLQWADDVILLDSCSEDRTVDLAKAARSDIRVSEHAFVDFGDQRNWALDYTEPRNEWVLFIDADERITPQCSKAIAKVIAKPEDNVGFYLTCRNYFLGRWIKHCTLFPSWQLRLLRRGQVRYQKEGHGQREVTEGPLGYINEPYDHYGFSKGISDWVNRHNHYSTNEVQLIQRLREEPLALSHIFSSDSVERRRCLKRLAARTHFRACLRFVYMYFIRLGFLDGVPGFIFCRLRVAHEIIITAKLAEADKKQE